MPFNICFEGVSGKRGIFLNGKLVIEVFFLSRPAMDFSYLVGAFSVIVQLVVEPMERFAALKIVTRQSESHSW